MSCSCVFVEVDESYESYEDIAEKVRTAPINHVCIECGDLIKHGERHEAYIGCDSGGNLHSTRTCLTCLDLRSEFFCGDLESGTVLNRLIEHIDEEDGEISSECILRLSKPARGVVIDIIDDVFKDLDWLDEQELEQ